MFIRNICILQYVENEQFSCHFVCILYIYREMIVTSPMARKPVVLNAKRPWPSTLSLLKRSGRISTHSECQGR